MSRAPTGSKRPPGWWRLFKEWKPLEPPNEPIDETRRRLTVRGRVFEACLAPPYGKLPWRVETHHVEPCPMPEIPNLDGVIHRHIATLRDEEEARAFLRRVQRFREPSRWKRERREERAKALRQRAAKDFYKPEGGCWRLLAKHGIAKVTILFSGSGDSGDIHGFEYDMLPGHDADDVPDVVPERLEEALWARSDHGINFNGDGCEGSVTITARTRRVEGILTWLQPTDQPFTLEAGSKPPEGRPRRRRA